MKTALKFLKHPIWLISSILIVIISVYWAFIATDRYVSKAHVVLQTSDIAPPELSFTNMLSGAAASNTSDLLLLRDYLLSVDMLKILDEQLNLRTHFSNPDIDYFSRMGEVDEPIEYFHEYYLKRVDVNLDDYSGVLRVSASAFDKTTAIAIVELLLKYGEQRMNQMGQRLASEQVDFIERQVHDLNLRLESARNAVLAYQDKEGLISPTGTVESLSAVIAELKAQLSKLEAQKSMMSQFQSARSAEMIKLNSEIAALKKQVAIENAKLTATQGKALNKVTAEYETLKLRAQFAQELYSNALATLEATRVEAARKLKQVAVLQTPTHPEYAVQPDRIYNITVSVLFIFIITLILNMVLVIIKDHRD